MVREPRGDLVRTAPLLLRQGPGSAGVDRLVARPVPRSPGGRRCRDDSRSAPLARLLEVAEHGCRAGSRSRGTESARGVSVQAGTSGRRGAGGCLARRCGVSTRRGGRASVPRGRTGRLCRRRSTGDAHLAVAPDGSRRGRCSLHGCSGSPPQPSRPRRRRLVDRAAGGLQLRTLRWAADIPSRPVPSDVRVAARPGPPCPRPSPNRDGGTAGDA